MGKKKDDTGLRETPGSTGGISDRVVEKSEIPAKSQGGESDFLGQLDRLARKARAQGDRGGEAAVGDLEPDFGATLVSNLGIPETRVGRLLREAKARIASGEPREALALLDELLAEEPGHPEALILKTDCHVRLEE